MYFVYRCLRRTVEMVEIFTSRPYEFRSIKSFLRVYIRHVRVMAPKKRVCPIFHIAICARQFYGSSISPNVSRREGPDLSPG